MFDPQDAYDALIARLVCWAEAEDNVRGAALIGSRARTDHPADAWSDLDVILLARDPQPLWTETDWLHQLGEPWLMFREPRAVGAGHERRVLYAGGLDVDLIPEGVAELEQALRMGLPSHVVDIIHQGMRVLVDKDGLWARVRAASPEPQPPRPPSEEAFLNVVHDFWYHTVWTAKHLCRGELWWGKICCDSYLKGRVLTMIEWHARTVRAADADTWMRGRFLEEWADPRAVTALSEAYAHYDPEDVWRALGVTMDLFRWLSMETAEALGITYPERGAHHAEGLVRRLYHDRPR